MSSQANYKEPVRAARLIGAGLVAGLILNIGEAALHGAILAEPTQAAYADLNRIFPDDASFLVALIVWTFAQGLAMMWLSALLQSSVGSNVRTALYAGTIVWSPRYIPPYLVWLPVVWQLLEYPLATYAGVAIYRSGSSQAASGNNGK